eukprot:15365067-Ditylum_brightwellii.AAC.1
MSNLLHAQKKPLLEWYCLWLKLSDIGKPRQDINDGMRQPDTIKVFWDQPDSTRSSGTWALSVSIVLNKRILGAEYSLIYTTKK